MALAVLTVDAACKIISPEFPRRVAPFMVSSHRNLTFKSSSLCSFFLNDDPSFEVSVVDLLETTRYFKIKNLEVCLQLCTP